MGTRGAVGISAGSQNKPTFLCVYLPASHPKHRSMTMRSGPNRPISKFPSSYIEEKIPAWMSALVWGNQHGQRLAKTQEPRCHGTPSTTLCTDWSPLGCTSFRLRLGRVGIKQEALQRSHTTRCKSQSTQPEPRWSPPTHTHTHTPLLLHTHSLLCLRAFFPCV